MQRIDPGSGQRGARAAECALRVEQLLEVGQAPIISLERRVIGTLRAREASLQDGHALAIGREPDQCLIHFGIGRLDNSLIAKHRLFGARARTPQFSLQPGAIEKRQEDVAADGAEHRCGREATRLCIVAQGRLG